MMGQIWVIFSFLYMVRTLESSTTWAITDSSMIECGWMSNWSRTPSQRSYRGIPLLFFFSAPNCLAGSTDEDEIALMKVLSQPNWVNAPTQAMKDAGDIDGELFKSTWAPFVNSALSIASIYFPGDECI